VFPWQPIFAFLIVLAAALWMALRVLKTMRSVSRGGQGHASNCGSCQHNPEVTKAAPLVQLGKKSDK
jgi:hypothetical protein